MIRISEEAKETLHRLAEQTGESMQAALSKAIEIYRRKRFLEEVNRAYAAVRRKSGEWSQIRKERQEWDRALLDGLDPKERWPKN